MNRTTEIVLASRWARLGSSIIDAIIMAIPILVYSYLRGDFDNMEEMPKDTTLESIMYIVVSYITFFLVNIKFLLNNGQTIGKKILNIKIVNIDNDVPSKKDLLKRYLTFFGVKEIPVAGIWLSLIDILFIFSKNKQCGHDIVANTNVIECQ